MMDVANEFLSHPHKCYNDHIAHISQSFDDENHQIVALYHDLGKLSEAFQMYISLEKESDETSEAFEKRRNKLKTTHTLESAYLYFCNVDHKDVDFLANFFAILKHHSNLLDIETSIKSYISIIDIHEERFGKIENIAKISKLLFSNDLFLFKYFFKKQIPNDFFNLDNFFLFKKRYSRLILADKYEAIFSDKYTSLKTFCQDDITKYLTTTQNIIHEKQKVSPNSERTKARDTIFDKFEKKSDENIYFIKAPTGVGKTFIALELALKIVQKQKDKRRIITALPFTSIIDQTHQEYVNIIGAENVLKYHHLTKYKEEQDADEKEQFSQKVFLTDVWHEHFIVTTFNQLLFTLFSNHNRDNLRLETLRDSVIIIDEVQNIPRVLLQEVYKVLKLFSDQYNIHFIIMSATMPSLDGCYLSEDFFYEQKKSRYQLSYRNDITGFDELAYAINQQNNASVLCVVNTIEKAKTLFDLVNGKEGVEKYLLTTHQIPLDRKEIIEEIKDKLKEGKKIVLIATQLIEAGVDLDFDVGFREFAPFGSIIQMAGRVNREGKKPISDVFIFDCIDVGRGKKAQKAPYHAIDYQEDKIKELIKNPIAENAILKHIDDYFVEVKDQTYSADLLNPMKNLEFATLFQRFNDNFMPRQPWRVSLFVEQETNQFQKYIDDREKIITNTDNKFDAMNEIKELEKDLGLYTISVSEKLIKELQKNHNIKMLFGRYILPVESDAYTKYRGFNPELTRIEEALGFDEV